MNKTTLLAAASVAAVALALAGFYLFTPVDAPAGQAGASAKPAKKSGANKLFGRKPGQPKPYGGDLPSLAQINVRNAVLDKVHSGLDYPWAMEFTSPSELLITEFGGRLLRYQIDSDSLTEIEGLPADIATGKGQVGLMDVALHPEFSENGVIYLSHAVRNPEDPELYATAVSRAQLSGERLLQPERIFTALPWAKSSSNFGGALEFDARGYLYIGTGDRSKYVRSQDGQMLNGKIIRLNDDGTTPRDNPFVGDPAVDDRIYALGVRNPQGLVFDRATGILYESEHGPMGGDEINRIEAGANYGWPVISYGADYTTQKKGVGTARPGMEQPLFYYLPSIATSPLTIYRGSMFPEWEGDLMVGALKGSHVNKLDLLEGRILSEHRILRELKGRIRDIKVARDGSVWILVQNGGRLFRLYRDPGRADLEDPEQRKGGVVYKIICASCHSAGLQGVPQLDKPDEWRERVAGGREPLYRNTIDGMGAMPPRGLCENCSDEELRVTVDWMLNSMKLKARRSQPESNPQAQ